MYRDGPKKVATSGVMTGRTKALKSLEETYGVKYETPVPKANQKSVVKTSAMTTITYKDRGDMDYNDAVQSYRPNYNKYLITAGDHYHEGSLNTTRRTKAVSFNAERQSTLEHSHAELIAKQEQYFNNKSEQNTTNTRTSSSNTKSKTARSRRTGGDDLISYQNSMAQETSSALKRDATFIEEDSKKSRHDERHHQHHHTHRHHPQSKQVSAADHNASKSLETIGDDKDDDTEEFISLIKRAVEKSVTSSLNEVLSNTFSDFNKKLEKQSAEIKKLGTILQKLHNGLNNKISHYGEENSRHFRYLCMKSEYDKMFYQHHNQLVSKSAPTTPPTTPPTPRAKEPTNNHIRTTLNTGKCSLQSTRTLVPEPSMKPLDENMRDMVAQLKRFCLQYESAVILEEDLNKSGTSGSSGLRLDNSYQERRRSMFQDDETNISSDGMTPRSMDNMSRMEPKRSKTSLAAETLNSMNDDSIGGGDANNLY